MYRLSPVDTAFKGRSKQMFGSCRIRNFFHRHAFKHEILIIVFFVVVLIGYYELIVSPGIENDF